MEANIIKQLTSYLICDTLHPNYYLWLNKEGVCHGKTEKKLAYQFCGIYEYDSKSSQLRRVTN